jgi:AraC family transcriptional regulator, regulatory protein of adaptative response / methylated-DNA-[protein]-cysteine methyltransferase
MSYRCTVPPEAVDHAALDESPPYQSPDSRWEAVVGRDREADGHFLYAVKTTGIFCRPGCPSRLPNRVNVAFFDDLEAAIGAGYRACKRCRPRSDSPGESEARIVSAACRSIERADRTPGLKELASASGLSPWHFHRVFKGIIGVTPKQYAATHQRNRFRERLEKGASVSEAIYDAGFGSSSRAYEGSNSHLGMTPTEYRKGGAGLEIRYAIGRCFLGWALVAVTGRGICAIELADSPDSVKELLIRRFPEARIDRADAGFDEVVSLVTEFIQTPWRGLDLDLDMQGTAFQHRVWKVLRDIPPGETASYGEIARRIGKPEAARAVAGACAANPTAVVVPCHRAVRRDGGIGGYRWGEQRKRDLLKREATKET